MILRIDVVKKDEELFFFFGGFLFDLLEAFEEFFRGSLEVRCGKIKQNYLKIEKIDRSSENDNHVCFYLANGEVRFTLLASMFRHGHTLWLTLPDCKRFNFRRELLRHYRQHRSFYMAVLENGGGEEGEEQVMDERVEANFLRMRRSLSRRSLILRFLDFKSEFESEEKTSASKILWFGEREEKLLLSKGVTERMRTLPAVPKPASPEPSIEKKEEKSETGKTRCCWPKRAKSVIGQTLVLLCDENGNVLMGCKKTGPGKGFWNAPGGDIEQGEASEASAKRELKEETGLIADEIEKRGELELYRLDKSEKVLLDVYFCRSFRGVARRQGKEFQDISFRQPPYEGNQMYAGDKLWWPLILEGQMVQGKIYYENGYRKVLFSDIRVRERAWRNDRGRKRDKRKREIKTEGAYG